MHAQRIIYADIRCDANDASLVTLKHHRKRRKRRHDCMRLRNQRAAAGQWAHPGLKQQSAMQSELGALVRSFCAPASCAQGRWAASCDNNEPAEGRHLEFLGLRHCESVCYRRTWLRKAAREANLLESGADVSYRCFTSERVLHPLRQDMVLHRVTSCV